MGFYDRKDRFFKRAKETGFRSRAAFKLTEIQKKFQILKPKMIVLDLGCWPGSWLQVISKEVGPSGRVIGIDLEDLPPFSEKNITFIRGDIRKERTQELLHATLSSKVDLVLSDMAPHLTGIKFQDQYYSYELAQQAFELCKSLLKETGNFVVKIFPGEDFEKFKGELRVNFQQIKAVIPEATRKTSNEVYLIAKNFKASKQS